MNILRSAEELKNKKIQFTGTAKKELSTICAAVNEITALTFAAFKSNSAELAKNVEPLEEVVDELKRVLRKNHTKRLQNGECSIDAGFVWADLLTSLERTSDHCSNIAGCIMETAHSSLNMHESVRMLKEDNAEFRNKYKAYLKKYAIK